LLSARLHKSFCQNPSAKILLNTGGQPPVFFIAPSKTLAMQQASGIHRDFQFTAMVENDTGAGCVVPPTVSHIGLPLCCS
jgi:hypothetical protein